MIQACRHNLARRLQRIILQAAGIVIFSNRKLLIVGDSVMGCILQAPGDGDASSGSVSYMVTLFRVRMVSLSHNEAATH